VSVNKDEAKLLAHRVIEDNIELDLKKLYIQGNVENSAKQWFKLPYELRGCVFLNKNGECRIYDDRPSVCRTNNVLSDPRMCDTSDGVEKPIRLLNTDKADLAIIASYQQAGEAGTLPYMLWKELDNRGENTAPRKMGRKVGSLDVNRVKKALSKILDL
jgi:Fe-S-cluster containining protein